MSEPTTETRTVEDLLAENALLQRKVDSLKSELKRSDDEYEVAIAERDRYQLAWKSARRRAQNHSETVDRLATERDAYVDWLESAELQLVDVNRIADWRAVGRDS